MPGETDVINAPDVAELISAAAAGSPEVITADLTATEFCDSAGVEVLARARDMAAARGVEFRLALGGSPVARILQLTGLDEVMPLYRDVPHSLATPPGPAGPRARKDAGKHRHRGVAVVRQAGARQIATLTEETMSAPAANSVSWFEIGAPDVDAAKAFYGPLFGWSFEPDRAYT